MSGTLQQDERRSARMSQKELLKVIAFRLANAAPEIANMADLVQSKALRVQLVSLSRELSELAQWIAAGFTGAAEASPQVGVERRPADRR